MVIDPDTVFWSAGEVLQAMADKDLMPDMLTVAWRMECLEKALRQAVKTLRVFETGQGEASAAKTVGDECQVVLDDDWMRQKPNRAWVFVGRSAPPGERLN